MALDGLGLKDFRLFLLAQDELDQGENGGGGLDINMPLSLGLIWFATIASMLGYESLVGAVDKKWFDADHAVPVTTQLLTQLSLLLTGVVIGQVVRRVKGMAVEYAQRMAAVEKMA